ncbi:hypothetical protein J5N97_012752 [Dioscorea zingiberensis]|uniref:Uncharacterized protein n=1 Tax=Dioscorea zingiberensis TaxID=325984 RepID=A0A9D5CPJ2_9LILI|nr:hypothetical protein J5N97_012752 [Dioscorea zingiberensis]
MEKRDFLLTNPKVSKSARRHVAQFEEVDKMKSQQLAQPPFQKGGHMAPYDATEQHSSQQAGSCTGVIVQTGEIQINDESISNDEFNENPIKSVTIYSKHANTKQMAVNDDEDTVEEYLDPILEKEIELEFQSLWNSQLEEEESYHSEGPSNKPTEEKPDEIFTGPLNEPPIDQLGSNLLELKGYQEDDSKTPGQEESPTLKESQNIPPHTPSRTIGKEITIPGPPPDIDLSNYSWRFIQGSWNFMANEAGDDIAASTEPIRSDNLEDNTKGDPSYKKGAPHWSSQGTAVTPHKEATVKRLGL